MTATDKTLYLPRMADHAEAIAGAMRHHGVKAEVLPPPDEETMAIGLDLCRGRECLPCLLCTGDMVRRARQPGFDPARSLFFMPTGPGPCRFGQYRYLEQDILEAAGLGELEVLSPNSADSYALFGEDPTALRKLVFQGVAAVDLLAKLRNEHRPYETVKGAVDAAHAAGLAEVAAACERGGGEHLVEAMRRAAERFEQVPTAGRGSRPLVAMVGELYVMLNAWSNSGLTREIEHAGGEVMESTFMDWLHFTAWTRRKRGRMLGDWRDWLGGLAVGMVQDGIEHRLHRAAAPGLRRPAETPVAEIMRSLAPHYDPILGTEAVITMGRALDYMATGAAGIVNVLPFSCMPGIVVAAMAPRLRAERGDVPWLDLSFDGQRETNTRTRLEAFMHQVQQFERRRAGAPEAAAPSWRDVTTLERVPWFAGSVF